MSDTLLCFCAVKELTIATDTFFLKGLNWGVTNKNYEMGGKIIFFCVLSQMFCVCPPWNFNQTNAKYLRGTQKHWHLFYSPIQGSAVRPFQSHLRLKITVKKCFGATDPIRPGSTRVLAHWPNRFCKRYLCLRGERTCWAVKIITDVSVDVLNSMANQKRWVKIHSSLRCHEFKCIQMRLPGL